MHEKLCKRVSIVPRKIFLTKADVQTVSQPKRIQTKASYAKRHQGITLMSWKDRIRREILTFQTKRVNRKKQTALHNTPVTLVSNNCTGGILLHDFGKRFDTPFINMAIYAEDFYRLVTNLPTYLSIPLKEDENKSESYGYPVAVLGDVMIRFPHDSDFSTVLKNWNRRIARVDYEHIFVLWVGYQDELPESMLERIANVPYPKVVFLNHERKDIPYAFRIKGFEDQKGVGHVWANEGLSGRKYYDQFPIAKWLKKESDMGDYL